jgi:predicted ATPase
MDGDRFVVLSGCSGGGKSTLLAELARRGFATVEEPGRRIVREGLADRGRALPWVDPIAFLERAVALSLEDRRAAKTREGWVFFDRGLVDAASGLGFHRGDDTLMRLGLAHRYHSTVFLTPPWPRLYATDAERRHSFEDAVGEYDRLAPDFQRLGYAVVILPRVGVAARADLVLSRLS